MTPQCKGIFQLAIGSLCRTGSAASDCGTIAKAVLAQPAVPVQSLSLQPLSAVMLACHVT